jgi:hypothetical protein
VRCTGPAGAAGPVAAAIAAAARTTAAAMRLLMPGSRTVLPLSYSGCTRVILCLSLTVAVVGRQGW